MRRWNSTASFRGPRMSLAHSGPSKTRKACGVAWRKRPVTKRPSDTRSPRSKHAMPQASYRPIIYGTVLPHNTSMLRLAANAQGTMTTSRDENAVHVTVLFPDGSSTASTVSEFPFQEGSSLNTVGINYKTLNAAAAPSTSASWRPLRHPEAEYISL